LFGVFLICLDVLAIEVLYHVDIKGYASSIAMACPLRILIKLVHVAAADQELYHLPGPLICFDIIILVQFLHPLLLQPTFCIGELANCAIDVELSGSEVPSGKKKGSAWSIGRKAFTYNKVASSWLGRLADVPGFHRLRVWRAVLNFSRAASWETVR
jgi:hypothetical protein